jgi:hypothetical protein
MNDYGEHGQPRPLATLTPPEQLACYSPWLKVEVALRLVLTRSWTPEAWQEVQQHIPWLLTEQEPVAGGSGSSTSGKERWSTYAMV